MKRFSPNFGIRMVDTVLNVSEKKQKMEKIIDIVITCFDIHGSITQRLECGIAVSLFPTIPMSLVRIRLGPVVFAL